MGGGRVERWKPNGTIEILEQLKITLLSNETLYLFNVDKQLKKEPSRILKC